MAFAMPPPTAPTGAQFRKEIPVHRTSAIDEEMKKYQTQWGDHKNRGNKRNRRCQRALNFAPGLIVCSFQMHRYCTARVTDVVVMVRSRSCARRFTRIV